MANAKKEVGSPFVPVEEQPYKVPENWCWTYWGNCGRFIAGSGFKNQYQGFTEYNIPFYKVGSLKLSDADGYLYDNSNTVNEEIRTELNATLIPTNSILFAKIGEAIRLNRRSMNSSPCCIDNNMMAFVASACTYKYAFYWSKGIDLYDYTNATTVPAIRKSDLEMVAFPLPPLPEQQRIVDRIESLFAKLDEAKEKAQAVVDGFELRKSAILHKAFTGELTAQWRDEHGVGMESWEVQKLSSFSTVVSGYAFSSKDFSERGIPCVKITNVGVGNYLSDNYEYLPIDYLKTHERFCVNHGDILISLTRSYISAGLKVCIYDDEPTALLNQRVGLIKDCNTQYIYYFLRTEEVLNYVKEKSKTTNQPNLSIKDLNMLPVPVATVEEQNEIVCVLNTLLLREQQATETAEAVLDQIDTMKKAILARAFRGELGTNNPDEESAAELLTNTLASN